VVQETRHWDEADGRTHSMRSKEEAFDYRYFPEPDLVTLDPGPEWVAEVKGTLPVLPAERRARVAAAAGVDASAEPVATVVRLGLDDIVAAAVVAKVDPGLALRRLANEVAGELADVNGGTVNEFDTDSFLRLVALEERGELTPAQARTVLKVLVAEGGDPASIAAGLGYQAMSADVLEEAVDQVITDNPREWERYSGGDDKLAGFFIGKVKAATAGNADLRVAADLLRRRREAGPT
jgi:aspartyl-tRNA(Asn)/glutamyl-tRNA(Gln) amidotransferase subunit B